MKESFSRLYKDQESVSNIDQEENLSGSVSNSRIVLNVYTIKDIHKIILISLGAGYRKFKAL